MGLSVAVGRPEFDGACDALKITKSKNLWVILSYCLQLQVSNGTARLDTKCFPSAQFTGRDSLAVLELLVEKKKAID